MTKLSFLVSSSILVSLFIFIHLHNPGKSFSGEDQSTADTVGNAISDQSSGEAVIGQIKTRDKVIVIRSGADGQIYTVKSEDGDLLADDLNTEELNKKFPELKEVVENGLAGDASLRMNSWRDHKVNVTIQGVSKK